MQYKKWKRLDLVAKQRNCTHPAYIREKLRSAAGLGSGLAGDSRAVTERLCGDPRRCAIILTASLSLKYLSELSNIECYDCEEFNPSRYK